ncbi:hypothetical protein [Hyphomicrobium sp. DY-1]|uniref:hypothetical protein n=1 Tax=Hyphomicrobium sp. DY-1 TaxID=3075650 RepID=UPI0039C2CAB4
MDFDIDGITDRIRTSEPAIEHEDRIIIYRAVCDTVTATTEVIYELPEIEVTPRLETTRFAPDPRQGGNSKKVRNIRVNWESVKDKSARWVPSIAGAVAKPWLAPFVVLCIWRDVQGLMEVKLSPHHAAAIEAMWLACDSDMRISRNTAFTEINSLLKKYSIPIFDEPEFESCLQVLSKLKSIEFDEGSIRIVEWVCRRRPLRQRRAT